MADQHVITQFAAAILGLGLNEAAYMAEIVRAGIGAVDKGQTEAAEALGMSPATTYRRVILPQAARLIVPPTANQTISMLKLTSLVPGHRARPSSPRLRSSSTAATCSRSRC